MSEKFLIAMIPENEDGGYQVEVIGMPGCVTQGDTVEECLVNAKEAIQVHIEGSHLSEVNKSMFDINPVIATVEVDYKE